MGVTATVVLHGSSYLSRSVHRERETSISHCFLSELLALSLAKMWLSFS